MKLMTLGAAIVFSSLLAGCMGTGGKVAPQQNKQENKAAAGAEAETDRNTVSDAEMQYVKALREADKTKRNELFKAARKALLAEAEKNKNYKAHLLLGYIADLGQGMAHDGIQAARHYRIAADGGLVEAKIALAEFWRRNEIFLEDAAKQITSIPGYEENPAALCVLGSIYYAMFENDKGFEVLKKAYYSEKRTNNTRLEVLKILHQAFEKYFRGKNFDAAMKELKRSGELEPKNYLTTYLMALVEIQRGNFDEAEKLLNRSLKLNPAIPEIYRELAFLNARAGKSSAAMDNAKIAYAVSGKQPEFERAFLEICVLTKNTDTLLTFSNDLLKVNPNRQEIRLVRLPVLLLKHDYRPAYDDLTALMKNPRVAKDPAILESYAIAASALGKYDNAVKANEEILKAGFRPVPALNLAELYIVTNQYDKALKLLAHPDFKGQKEPLIPCVVPYLEACAKLASGVNAESSVQTFRMALPVFAAARKDSDEWDVTMFRKWLKDARLAPEVKIQISELTDALVSGQPAKAEVKKTPETAKKPEVKNVPGADKKPDVKNVPGADKKPEVKNAPEADKKPEVKKAPEPSSGQAGK